MQGIGYNICKWAKAFIIVQLICAAMSAFAFINLKGLGPSDDKKGRFASRLDVRLQRSFQKMETK